VYTSNCESYVVPPPHKEAVIVPPLPTILYQTSLATLPPLQSAAGPSIVAKAVLPLATPPQAMGVAAAQLSLAGAAQVIVRVNAPEALPKPVTKT
jgi:hypothetical protein